MCPILLVVTGKAFLYFVTPCSSDHDIARKRHQFPQVHSRSFEEENGVAGSKPSADGFHARINMATTRPFQNTVASAPQFPSYLKANVP